MFLNTFFNFVPERNVNAPMPMGAIYAKGKDDLFVLSGLEVGLVDLATVKATAVLAHSSAL